MFSHRKQMNIIMNKYKPGAVGIQVVTIIIAWQTMYSSGAIFKINMMWAAKCLFQDFFKQYEN